MDQGIGNRVTPLDAAQGAQLQSKECDFALESQEIIIPIEGNCPNSSPHLLAGILDGGTIEMSMNPAGASEHTCSSAHFMDDAATAGFVEELTVKNIGSSSIAIVGTSNSREVTQNSQNHWQHLYHLASGSGIKSSCGDPVLQNNAQGMRGDGENSGDESFREFSAQHASRGDCNEVMEQATDAENKEFIGNALAPGAIRTKILSKSGFPEFFIKSTLKGKGFIHRGPSSVDSAKRQDVKLTGGDVVVSDNEANLCLKTTVPSSCVTVTPRPASEHGGITLREWLKSGRNKVNKVQSLCIFRQIVQLLDDAHCKGEILHVRPSCFRLLPSDQVRYIGSPVHSEMLENSTNCNFLKSDNCASGKRPAGQGNFSSLNINGKKQKCDEGTNIIKQWPHLYSRSLVRARSTDSSSYSATNSKNKCSEPRSEMKYVMLSAKPSRPVTSSTAQQQLTPISDEMEEKWYTSPEELNDKGCTISSNIYCLGVLLFELLVHFDSEIAHSAAMSDLHHRILPPHILSEHPKEAGFCLWLLHPEPSSRPTVRKILQSEVITISQDIYAEDVSSSIEQEDADSELLLHFLVVLKEQKLKHASKLRDDIRCLETDIEEVERRTKFLVHSEMLSNLPGAEDNNVLYEGPLTPKPHTQFYRISSENERRLTKNIIQLESAYFSMRSEIQPSGSNAITRPDSEPLRVCENWDPYQTGDVKPSPNDCIGAFFGGLCKYARYNKFQVRGVLRNGEFNNSANVICALSFDRDEDYFAAAGVSKKIKVYEFNGLFNDSVDIHYPAVEMSNESKLSCICWNNYIRNYLASADYDGVVKVWDVNSGQDFLQYTEHQKRAWSVDFSQVDPTKMASGSDDFSVKLWNINESNCLGTIRTIANVCCVQFSAHSTNMLAFGSADYKIYCFDLRNVKSPWCVLGGHDKAVSYVKFLDSETLVSASTDSTLKIWDLSKTSPSGLSTNACKLTLSGHTNEKNFVGLSVSDGYIACGSETNEVYAYYRSFPMPITSHKFGSVDPVSGNETEDDNRQFVSSVCWRGKSDMVVAANSSGCIKVLQMV